MNTIYIEPEGGLCNRMRSIVSAYSYARDNNYEMVIIWPRKEELNCKFQELFNPIYLNNKKVKVINLPYVGPGIVNKGHNTISEIVKNKYKRKCNIYFDQLIDCSVNNSFYIKSFEEWYKNNNTYNIFSLNKKINEKLNNFKKQFSPSMVGVHIRRTDNIISINSSPTELYIKKMTEMLNENKARKFFLASDDENEINKLKTVFGNEMILSQSNIDRRRNNSNGIKDALLDLYLLANTELIIGSYYSSFTDVAAAINQKQLIVIGNDESEKYK